MSWASFVSLNWRWILDEEEGASGGSFGCYLPYLLLCEELFVRCWMGCFLWCFLWRFVDFLMRAYAEWTRFGVGVVAERESGLQRVFRSGILLAGYLQY